MFKPLMLESISIFIFAQYTTALSSAPHPVLKHRIQCLSTAEDTAVDFRQFRPQLADHSRQRATVIKASKDADFHVLPMMKNLENWQLEFFGTV